MKHFSITIFSGLVFLVATFFVGVLPVSTANVSRETGILSNYRETLSVKQGVSQDGQLAITKIPNAPAMSPRVKSANRARTLRAFVAPNRGGVLTLYVESVLPHEYYSLTGGFVVLENYPVLAWSSETSLTFYGMSPKGELMHYTADVHQVTFSQKTLEPSAPIPSKSIPSADLLP